MNKLISAIAIGMFSLPVIADETPVAPVQNLQAPAAPVWNNTNNGSNWNMPNMNWGNGNRGFNNGSSWSMPNMNWGNGNGYNNGSSWTMPNMNWGNGNGYNNGSNWSMPNMNWGNNNNRFGNGSGWSMPNMNWGNGNNSGWGTPFNWGNRSTGYPTMMAVPVIPQRPMLMPQQQMQAAPFNAPAMNASPVMEAKPMSNQAEAAPKQQNQQAPVAAPVESNGNVTAADVRKQLEQMNAAMKKLSGEPESDAKKAEEAATQDASKLAAPVEKALR